MLLSEIIYNIKNLKAGGHTSDDEKISDRQWAFIVNYYRAVILKQDASKSSQISTDVIQNLGKVELIEVDPSGCGCDGYGCVLRTKYELPATIAPKEKSTGFMYVGELGLDAARYQETTYSNIYWDSFRKYTSKEPRWFYADGHIYIVNPIGLLSYINIQGIFEDPTKANKFRTCDCPDNNEPCNVGFNYEYPFEASNMDRLMSMVANAEMRMQLTVPPDTVNDGIDTN
jgi:hypothetical protein